VPKKMFLYLIDGEELMGLKLHSCCWESQRLPISA